VLKLLFLGESLDTVLGFEIELSLVSFLGLPIEEFLGESDVFPLGLASEFPLGLSKFLGPT
jgi:hypothetical protein